MKIALVTSFFYPVIGGAETHVLEIAKGLIKKGHEVDVLTSDLSRDGKIKIKEEVYSGIKIIRFKTWFKLGPFASFFPGFLTRLNKYDLIHIHVYRNPHNLAVLFTKKPCVMTLHWPNYPSNLRNLFNKVIIPLFDVTIGKLILKKCKLIAITGLEKDWIKEKFDLDSEIVPNGIPENYLKKRDGDRFRKKYSIKKNEMMVLSLSRLHKSKGFDQIIRVAKYFPKVKFFIAGKGEEEDNLKKLMIRNNLDNVKFIGLLNEEEKLEAYSAADIFIHPSHYEGFGIVILEAMSQGCAVLTSDKGGMPWVVEKSGLIFEDNNILDLRKKLELLVNNKKIRVSYSKNSLSRVKKFSWNNVTNQIEKIYERVI